MLNENVAVKLRLLATPLCLGVLLFFYFNCSKKKESSDGVSQSSQMMNILKAKTLPPKDTVYTVIGYVSGLKGYCIKYNENLFRGGDILSDSGASSLAKTGIKTVISVTPSAFQRELARKYKLHYIEFPFEYSALTTSQLAHFLDILDNAELPLYINCHGGNQRAGNLCALYRIYKEKWSFERALIEYGKLGGKIREDFMMLRDCAAFCSTYKK